jgi:membrane protease YdiL (CAAX protease family)
VTPPPDDAPPAARRLLAPPRHNAVLIVIVLLSALAGAWLQRRPGSGADIAQAHRGAIGIYLTAMALDWALFFYMWVFLRKGGTRLRELVGGSWNPKSIALDVAIAAPFWIVWEWTARAVHSLLGPSTARTVDILLPRSRLEMAVWIAVSLTAGFCEEAVFRGYLQRQFHTLTGSAAIAVLAQAVLFGIAHGYQGIQNVIVITVLGLLYGLLALARRTLRPGMLAHAWSDVYGGLPIRIF